MFVLRSKYRVMERVAYHLSKENDMMKLHLQMVQMQLTAVLQSKAPATQFSDDDIKRLIQLCHPDKHGGSRGSVEMTQKLLQMRGR